MKCRLIMVPPGGGEADYSLDFDLPTIPRAGEGLCISRDDRATGYECFIVRSVRWELKYPSSKAHAVSGTEEVGKVGMIAVECEFAFGPFMTPEHQRACEAYRNRGKDVKTLDETMY